MNKFGIVLGIAAVAAVAGCKDPNYKGFHHPSSNDHVTPIPGDTASSTVPATPKQTGTPIGVGEGQHCTCPPGTVHAEPCRCGAPDCRCEVVPRIDVRTIPAGTQVPGGQAPGAQVPGGVQVPGGQTPGAQVPGGQVPGSATPGAAQSQTTDEPEYTIYIVQRGDYLSKISKKYNVTISSIKKLNNLTSDNIRIGQKLKLPGKIDVGEQTVPAGAIAKPAAKVYTPYTGATKEYVVKSGDTLGAIAYGNGINIRQLKELNGLSSDNLRIGQKLKIPAEKVVKPAAEKQPASVAKSAPAKADPVKDSEAGKAKTSEAAVTAAIEEIEETKSGETTAVVEETVVDPGVPTYVVQNGDDLTDVSIRFGVSAAAVRELNNLGENEELVPGQRLRLPVDAVLPQN